MEKSLSTFDALRDAGVTPPTGRAPPAERAPFASLTSPMSPRCSLQSAKMSNVSMVCPPMVLKYP
jgi:hypothetical protein